jgi:peroxiredoxin Q/BCP
MGTPIFSSFRVLLAGAALLAASSSACGGTVKRPDGGEGLLPQGSVAPELVGREPDGSETRLSALRGRKVVVYFYPKDGTPGCTTEACAFRDAWAKLDGAGIKVMGVSSNSVESHAEFQKEHKLPFPLVSDESGSAAQAYGVPRKLWGLDRVTFLVGSDGRVAKVFPAVDPGVHAAEVMQAAQQAP